MVNSLTLSIIISTVILGFLTSIIGEIRNRKNLKITKIMIETGASFDTARTILKDCTIIRQSLQADGTSKEEVDKAVEEYYHQTLKRLF
jgi:hypothetical protein